MSVQASLNWKNILGKEDRQKNIFEKLSQAVKVSGRTGTTDADSAGSSMQTTGIGGQKTDGFSIQSMLMEYLDPTAGLSEEEKQAYEARIMQKLKSGKELTPEETNYLRAKNPVLYAQVARVEAMRENLKQQLENCRSKEEVENVYGTSMSMVSKDDPMKEYIVAAYDDVTKEFKESDKYKSLPEKEEDVD